MQALKCDRCYRFYDHYHGGEEFKKTGKSNSVMLIDEDLERKYFSRKTFNLCPDCMAEMEKFLNLSE